MRQAGDRCHRSAGRARSVLMRRPEDIKARIGNIEQVEGVVVAMRALAAAHAQEARKHLRAIREQEATVARAMVDALPLLDAPLHATTGTTDGAHLRIVVGAAQGFSGTYNERIVSGAIGNFAVEPSTAFLLIGQRCISEFEIRGRSSVWSADMAAHAAEVPALANRVVDAVFRLLGRGAFTRVSVVYSEPAGSGQNLTVRQLMPFDFSRFETAARPDAPLTTLAPPVLVTRLVEEYVFTEICEALMLGFAAENDARMAAMSRARTNVRHIREELGGEFAQARQEQTTTEIIELSDDTK
jgi:F-type H+-transporting ATPase subunit gamma